MKTGFLLHCEDSWTSIVESLEGIQEIEREKERVRGRQTLEPLKLTQPSLPCCLCVLTADCKFLFISLFGDFWSCLSRIADWQNILCSPQEVIFGKRLLLPAFQVDCFRQNYRKRFLSPLWRVETFHVDYWFLMGAIFGSDVCCTRQHTVFCEHP